MFTEANAEHELGIHVSDLPEIVERPYALGEVVSDIPRIEERATHILRDERSIRGLLALGSFAMLIALLGSAFVAANWGDWSATEEYLCWATPIVTAVVGTALGYFFGQSQ